MKLEINNKIKKSIYNIKKNGINNKNNSKNYFGHQQNIGRDQ